MRFRRSGRRNSPVLQRAGVVLGGLVLLLLGSLLGLFAALPDEALIDRFIQELETQTQTEIESRDLDLDLPFALQGTEIVVRAQNLPQFPPIRIDRFRVSPVWTSLFSLNPGITGDARLMNGSVRAEYHRDGSLNLSANGLLLDLPIEQGFSLQLTGRLLEGRLGTVVPLSRETSSRVALTLDRVRLRGLTGQEDGLLLGTIVLELEGQGNSFRVTELRAVEGDFTLSGSGRVLLGNTPAASRLNLRLDIRPEATADPTLADLLRATARDTGNGAYQLRLSGSLARPVLN